MTLTHDGRSTAERLLSMAEWYAALGRPAMAAAARRAAMRSPIAADGSAETRREPAPSSER